MDDRRLPRGWLLVLPVVLLAVGCLLVQSGRAEPYFAQREGYKCSACHVNRTGGGMRTNFGYVYGLTHLSAFASPPGRGTGGTPKGLSEGGFIGRLRLDPNLNEHVAVGANLRFANTTSFADQVHNTFESPEANLYMRFRALEYLVGYADVSVAEGSVQARETFLMLDGWKGLSFKAGYLLLPYGLRIWGEKEFIRRETGYTYSAPDLGAELGFEKDMFSAFLAVSNGAGGGQDSDKEKQVSLLTEFSWDVVRFGLSGSFNQTRKQMNLLAGTYLGFTLGRLSLLAEVDMIRTSYKEEDADVYALVAYGEANFLLTRGLNLQVGYGFHDPALDVEENERMHLFGGIEFHPIPYVATRLRYDFRKSVPQDEVGNADVLLTELHFFF